MAREFEMWEYDGNDDVDYQALGDMSYYMQNAGYEYKPEEPIDPTLEAQLRKVLLDKCLHDMGTMVHAYLYGFNEEAQLISSFWSIGVPENEDHAHSILYKLFMVDRFRGEDSS